MRKILENRKLTMIISIAMMAINAIFIWIGVAMPYTPSSPDFVNVASIVLLVLAGVNSAVCVGNLIYILIKKKGSFFAGVFGVLSGLALIFFQMIYSNEPSFGAILVFVLAIIDGGLLIAFNVVKDKITNEEGEKISYRGRVSFVFNVLSMVALFMIFVVPLISKTEDGVTTQYIFIDILSNTGFIDSLTLIGFLVSFVFSAIGILFFMGALSRFFSNSEDYGKASRKSVYFNLVCTTLFFLMGVIMKFALTSDETPVDTIAYVPFIISGIITMAHAAFNYIYPQDRQQKKPSMGKYRLIVLLADIASIAIAFISIVVNIISINVETWSGTETAEINGMKIFFGDEADAIKQNFTVIVFLVLVIAILCAINLILTIVSFFSKSREFVYISKVNMVICFLFTFAVGIFGLYFSICKDVLIEQLQQYLDDTGWLHVNLKTIINFTVTSQSIYMIPVAVGVLVIVLIFKPFTKLNAELSGMINGEVSIRDDSAIDVNIVTPGFAGNPEVEDVNDSELSEEFAEENGIEQTEGPVEEEEYVEIIPGADEHDLPDFDPCPAFSELDDKEKAFKNDLRRRMQYPFPELNLPNLARFIVEYARDSRLHLSYTVEDIAQFIAGLGATRLSILQGMSGTGKTSLPKIFCEAIFGKVEIVEVESSWKDKNELLGYYNEFSKVYTPKKFTQALYRAKLNPEVVTLIVLDEMNLSRIEYYFSDFLSLMENEEDKREIKLLNTKLYNQYDGTRHAYTGLFEGHTLKIPTNVWFIGTANRDESTFEISDKVYDRANTMNFNKRAPKVRSFGEPKPQQFMTYQDFDRILKEAKTNFEFDLEEYEVVKKVEELLRPYNISFGNRILLQIENFVKVYCSCFTNSKDVIPDAVEKILLSKVVAKLEFKSIENKDELANKFDKLKLPSCAEFIRRLSGDF